MIVPDLVFNVVDASELKPGAVYALTFPCPLSCEQYEQIKQYLARFKEEHGISFIVLDGDVRISEVLPADAAEVEAIVDRALVKHLGK